ncbi:hypothetical protein [Pseudanabaena sp. FACHB-2040]|uniref:hypothetical protein n=1 Tax=Pseudanabaena sp. FACHB-2040 TaxID=2692859 RepID=UPI001684CB7F|nr:hypothetical protein [Pseudanabaena sp. FACHB-2040]MBD2261122.1 hypothetical protein [Pseudanabaena sp. FACHB-2040]
MTQATLSNRTMCLALRIREASDKPLTLRQSIRRAIWFQEQSQVPAEAYEELRQEEPQQPNE